MLDIITVRVTTLVVCSHSDKESYQNLCQSESQWTDTAAVQRRMWNYMHLKECIFVNNIPHSELWLCSAPHANFGHYAYYMYYSIYCKSSTLAWFSDQPVPFRHASPSSAPIRRLQWLWSAVMLSLNLSVLWSADSTKERFDGASAVRLLNVSFSTFDYYLLWYAIRYVRVPEVSEVSVYLNMCWAPSKDVHTYL